MDEIKTKLFLASSQRGWNLTLNDTEGIEGARPDDYLVEAICPSVEVAVEVKRFLITSQLIHKVKITQPLDMPKKPAGSAGVSLRYEGSDERGAGTGN
jgi:hypothetical protein